MNDPNTYRTLEQIASRTNTPLMDVHQTFHKKISQYIRRDIATEKIDYMDIKINMPDHEARALKVMTAYSQKARYD